MDYVAVGSLALALLSFGFQIFGAFPNHPKVRDTIVTMIIGIAVGAAVATLLGSELNITSNIDRQFVLLFLIIAVGLFFASLGTLLGDPEKRGAAQTIAAVTVGIFLATGVAVAVGSGAGPNVLSGDELITLANAAEQRGAYQNAIEYLQRFRSLRNAGADGDDQIRLRIEHLERVQMGRVAPPGERSGNGLGSAVRPPDQTNSR